MSRVAHLGWETYMRPEFRPLHLSERAQDAPGWFCRGDGGPSPRVACLGPGRKDGSVLSRAVEVGRLWMSPQSITCSPLLPVCGLGAPMLRRTASSPQLICPVPWGSLQRRAKLQHPGRLEDGEARSWGELPVLLDTPILSEGAGPGDARMAEDSLEVGAGPRGQCVP